MEVVEVEVMVLVVEVVVVGGVTRCQIFLSR